jgi:NAD(P)-dependent dehydrogenase (short-subunit alcohol dehydrogenase family)
MSPKTTLGGQTVLVTGCSSGLGLHAAVRLATAGHNVYATVRSWEGESLLEQRSAGTNGRLRTVEMDVTKPESIDAAVALIERNHGALDCLVSNAGIMINGWFEDVTEAEFFEVLNVNLLGAERVIRRALPALRRSTHARIVVIAGAALFAPGPGVTSYVASKWGLQGLCESLRHELSLVGVQMSVVYPGAFRTAMVGKNCRKAAGMENPQSPYYAASHRLFAKMQDYTQRRGADPEIVAKRIQAILEARRPRFRNICGRDAWMLWLAHRLLPHSVLSGAVRHLVGNATWRNKSGGPRGNDNAKRNE